MAGKRTVRLSIGLTVNLGNYESARIEVGLDEDIIIGDEETEEEAIEGINSVYASNRAWLVDRLREEKQRITKAKQE